MGRGAASYGGLGGVRAHLSESGFSGLLGFSGFRFARQIRQTEGAHRENPETPLIPQILILTRRAPSQPIKGGAFMDSRFRGNDGGEVANAREPLPSAEPRRHHPRFHGDDEFTLASRDCGGMSTATKLQARPTNPLSTCSAPSFPRKRESIGARPIQRLETKRRIATTSSP